MLRIFLIGLLVTASLIPNAILRAQNSQELNIVAGSESSTAAQLARDLESVLANTYSSIEVSTTTNAVDSVRRLQDSGAVGADRADAGSIVGIVPADILAFLENSGADSAASANDDLRFLLPLHEQPVHVFARRTIESLEDLNGKRVVLGPEHSRHWITATNILRIASVEPAEKLFLDTDDGVRAVLSDKADAMFYVDSLPAVEFGVFENWRADSQYGKLLQQTHLLPLNSPTLLDLYKASTIPAQAYSWLDDSVETIATTDILVSLNDADAVGEEEKRVRRCDRLQGLAASIRNSVAALSNSDSQLWTNVQLDRSVPNWKADVCLSQNEMDSEEMVSEKSSSDSVFDEELIDGLKKCLMKGECE